MRFRLSMVLLTVLMLGAGLALSQGEISFNDARVAATFAGADEPSTARAAIKATAEQMRKNERRIVLPGNETANTKPARIIN